MGRPPEREKVKSWLGKIQQSSKAYKDWEKKFHCADLESLYDGTGHWSPEEDPNETKYVINRTFATVETRGPTLYFYRPKARVIPRPTRADDPGSLIDERAMLLEDHADTLIANEKVGFMASTMEAMHDANFYFGLVEIGYTNNWVDNPNAGKPVIKEDGSELKSNGETVTQPARIPPSDDPSEYIYVRKIDPENFRVPLNAAQKLDQCDWLSYCEWQYVEDVKLNPIYKNTTGLRPTGEVKAEYEPGQAPDEKAGMVKLWKIWDLRAMKKLVIAEGHERILFEEPIKYQPFEDLRYYKSRKDWYPIPPVWQWRHPQRELNEIREDMRDFRQGSKPRYTHVDGAIDENEINKLKVGGSFTIVKSNHPDPIQEVPRSEGRLASLRTAIPEAREDFDEITAVPGEHRGISDAETATQASIIDINARVRESADREKVAKFLARVIKKMIMVSIEKMSLPFWIKLHVDPLGPNKLQETLKIANGWALVKAEDLEGIEWDVSVDVEALSPATEDLRRNQWLNFIGVMGTPGALPVLASETLLKKTAAFFGIRSDREVTEIRQSVLQAMQVQMMMGQMQGGGSTASAGVPTGPSGPVPAPQPGPIPTQEDTRQQLQAQGVGQQ